MSSRATVPKILKKRFCVHLVDAEGKTLCKAENNGRQTASKLDRRGDEIPDGARVCGICRQLCQEEPKKPRTSEPLPKGDDWNRWVNSDAFLQSYEWRKLRYQVLKEDGRKCRCCGTVPEQGAQMMVDHIKPRRRYPGLALERSNLQVLCDDCNQGKGSWDETDWRTDATSHLKSL